MEPLLLVVYYFGLSNKRSKADFTVGNKYFLLPIFRKARPSFLRVLHTMMRLSWDVAIWNQPCFRSFFFVTLVLASNLPWVNSHAALWKSPRRGDPCFSRHFFCKWAKVFPGHPCESGFGRFCLGWFFPCPSLPRGFWTCSVATMPRATAISIRSLSEVLVASKGGMFQFTET